MMPSQRAPEQNVASDQLIFAAESCTGPVDQSFVCKRMTHTIMTHIYPTDIIEVSMLHLCRGSGRAVSSVIWEESVSAT